LQFIKKDASVAHAIRPDVVRNLRQFRGVSKLKKAALRIFVKNISQDIIEDLREQFELFDTQGDGIITN